MKVSFYLRNFLSAAGLLLCTLLVFAPHHAWAQNPQMLCKIRSTQFQEKYLRLVFHLATMPDYTFITTTETLQITLKNSSASSEISTYHTIKDPLLTFIEINNTPPDLNIKIPLIYYSDYKLFCLNSPPRLVVDLNRTFTKIVQRKKVRPGLELLDIKIGDCGKVTNAHALLVDKNYNWIFPSLASTKSKKSLFEAVIDFFAQWGRKEEKFFQLATVSRIAKNCQAQAGINGTYFANDGLPLGILMIDQELLSYPVFERTALIITEDQQVYIDNLITNSSFYSQSGHLYEITGVNALRPENGVTIFTSAYGKKTNTPQTGIEITVVDDRVVNITLGNSDIPPNGYVLSATGASVEHLASHITVGEKIKLSLKLVPYTEALKAPLLHLLGGGPRLVKKGRPYIAKHEEKFKRDIAQGRKARSAVGITKKQQLILVAVDGPQKGEKAIKKSYGLNLEELASLMLFLDAHDAMNLDGGGSSTLVVNQRVINSPSGGGERGVSNALLIKPK